MKTQQRPSMNPQETMLCSINAAMEASFFTKARGEALEGPRWQEPDPHHVSSTSQLDDLTLDHIQHEVVGGITRLKITPNQSRTRRDPRTVFSSISLNMIYRHADAGDA